MNIRPLVRGFLPVAVFVIAAALTYVAVERRRSAGQGENQQASIWKVQTADAAAGAASSKGTIEGVEGLSEGEVVALPRLTKLDGQTVALDGGQVNHLLFAFFGSRCPGCTQDAELWKDLNRAAAERGVAFYLINVGDDAAELERFVAAYRLGELPVLFDPAQRVGRQLKVGFLPQYVLLTSKGEVLKRWDGLRHYDKSQGAAQLAEFFRPIR